jgi:2-polyprenyl-3-methyl-5-hydroxy-6-metoxy-1,4-benzoquinol methylase
LPSLLEVVCCSSCGAVFANTSAKQADYDRFYQAESIYADSRVSTGSGLTPIDRQRLFETAVRIVERTGVDVRVLDIGCANGGLLRELARCGVQSLWGVDPSPGCVKETKLGGKIQASVGTLFELPDFSAPFDVVILCHVLEHVYDLRRAVEVVRGLLGRDGVIYAEVPDASRYAAHVSAPFQDFNVEHINHFSSHALANLFAVGSMRQLAAGSLQLESAPGIPYPAIFGFFAGSSPPPSATALRDPHLRTQVVEYIGRSQALWGRIRSRIDQAMRVSSDVIVWGTGQFTFKLVAETSLAKARIVAFVDSNPRMQGKTLRGVPIVGPERLSEFPASLPVIIGTLIHHRQIVDQMTTLQIPNQAVTLD